MAVLDRNLVLVVDDDASMLRSVARLLRQLGYASLLFPSAEAFANHTDFDGAVCVILDINLGDVSGIELRHGLSAAGNSLPVIYMTGNDTPATREAALQSGCLAYLTKPYSAKSLMEPLRVAAAGQRAFGACSAIVTDDHNSNSITTRTDGAVNASFTICAHHPSRVWSTLCFVLEREEAVTASSR